MSYLFASWHQGLPIPTASFSVSEHVLIRAHCHCRGLYVTMDSWWSWCLGSCSLCCFSLSIHFDLQSFINKAQLIMQRLVFDNELASSLFPVNVVGVLFFSWFNSLSWFATVNQQHWDSDWCPVVGFRHDYSTSLSQHSAENYAPMLWYSRCTIIIQLCFFTHSRAPSLHPYPIIIQQFSVIIHYNHHCLIHSWAPSFTICHHNYSPLTHH